MVAQLRNVDVIRLMCADVLRSMEAASHLRGPCKADHPVTLENTVRVGKAGYRCRECRRQTGLKHWHTKAKFVRFPHLRGADQ